MTRELMRSLFQLEVRDLDVSGRAPFTTIEGRAVPYDTWANVGPYLERFKRGAFGKSTGEGAKSLPLMLFHGRDELWPIGRSTRWRDRPDGLHGEWELNDTANAQRAASMAKSGELGFLSIGFVDIRSVPDLAADYDPMLGEDHMDRVTRVEARLVEVSIVPTPAYADAEVTQVRAYRRPTGPDVDPTPSLTAWKRIAADLPR